MVDKRVSLVLLFLVLFCYSYFVQPPGWNENSRMALIMSVVRHHQLNIDRYEEYTGDKALYNYHYYSDKPIGTALLGVPVYAVGYAVFSKLGFEEHSFYQHELFYLVRVFVVSLP